MKKTLALLLVLCMVAVLLPAFGALSFAEPAAAAETLTPDQLHEGRTQLTIADGADGRPNKSHNIGAGDCGFIDGNAGVVEGTVTELLGVTTQGEVMAKTRVFVDGVEARFSTTYPGYTDRPHAGINGEGGYFYGVVGAAYTAGQESTLTIWAGDNYYIEQKFTPTFTTIAVASSTSHVYGDGGCDITVTFVDPNHGITEDDTVKVRAHDDHGNEKVFAVTSVNGATVTLHSDEYATGKTLLECTVSSGEKFSLSVDQYTSVSGVKGSVQYKDDTEHSKLSTRIVVEGNEDYLNTYKAAAIHVEFTTDKDETKTGDVSVTKAFRTLLADGQPVTTTSDCMFFGVEVINIPYGTKSLTATLILTDKDGEESKVTLGRANLPNPMTDLDPLLYVRNGYVWIGGETNVRRTTQTNQSTTGENDPNNLFNKDPSKYGYDSGGADQIFTWEYEEEKTVAMYEIFAGGDTGMWEGEGRNPTKWTLEGSNNGENYTVIDTQPNGGGLGDYYAGKSFTVSNPQPYKYYKITFGTHKDYFQLSEIRLFAEDSTVSLDNYTAIAGPDADHRNIDKATDANENLEKLFDGKTNTKCGIYGGATGDITVTWHYDSAEVVTMYSVTTGNDSVQYTRHPMSWTLYACNGDEDWVVLNTFDSSMFVDSATDYIVLNNKIAYTHYKLVFTMGRKDGQNAFQMSEVTLYKDAE